MKNLFSILFLFVFVISAFAATRIGYYSKNQTRDDVMKNISNYDQEMYFSKYTYYRNSKNKYDFEKKWQVKQDGFVITANVHYQFLESKVLITIKEAQYTIDNGKKVSLQENETMQSKRDLYDQLDKVLITNLFRYLKVSEKDIIKKIENNYQTQNYDSVSKYFSDKFTREQSKKLATDYINIVLKDLYEVKYLGSTPEDNWYNIKYTLDNEEGIQTVIVNYSFSLDGFTISINKVDFYNKIAKKTMLITKNNTSDEQQKHYELLKSYFLDKHSDYILTGEHYQY